MTVADADPIPLTDQTPRPLPPPGRHGGATVAFTITFRGQTFRQTISAKIVSTEDGWVKLKDEQGDVAVFPAGAILSIVRRTAESGR